MLPVPIAMPRALIKKVKRDENRGAALLMSDSWLLFILIFNKKGKVKLKYRGYQNKKTLILPIDSNR
jgi:hypothetical protein